MNVGEALREIQQATRDNNKRALAWRVGHFGKDVSERELIQFAESIQDDNGKGPLMRLLDTTN